MTLKDRLKDMLLLWGEWEADGVYAARAQRSMLGRIGESRATDGGRPLPPGVWIPNDVMVIGRLIAEMRETCRAGVRYARLIRQRYVAGETVTGSAIERAERWLLEAYKRGKPTP
jgi:hypothetical protein